MPRKQNINPDIYNKTLPARLRQEADKRGTTDIELAEAIGVQRQTIGYYKSGERVPDAEKLGKIAAFFGVSCDYLLGLSDVPAVDLDIRAAAELTGLTPEAVEALSKLLELGAEDITDFINIALHDVAQKWDFVTSQDLRVIAGADTEKARTDHFLRVLLPGNVLALNAAYYKAIGKEVKRALVNPAAEQQGFAKFIDENFVLFDVDGKEALNSFRINDLYLQALKDAIIKAIEKLKTGERV